MFEAFRVVLWIAMAMVLLVFALPGIGGYGYAVTMLPVYEQSNSCKDRKDGTHREDDYRVYLLNRGCSIQEAIGDLGKDLNMDPVRLMAFHRGEATPEGAAETLGWTAVQAQLQTFKSFSGSGCPPDCLASFWGDDVISQMFDWAFQKYLAIAIPIFLGGLVMGASHIAGIMQQGPLAQDMLYFAYFIIGVAIVGSALSELLKRVFK